MGIEAKDLLLLILYSPGISGKKSEPVVGITRLVKLIFVVQQRLEETKLKFEKFNYESYKLGPFSNQVYSALDFFENFVPPLIKKSNHTADRYINPENRRVLENIVSTDDPDYSPEDVNQKYLLTVEGEKVADYFWRQLEAEQKNIFTYVKREYGSLTLRKLLKRVYQEYPQFTDKSEIKGDLGL